MTGIGLLDPSGFVRMGLTTIPPDGAVTEGALVTASISLINFSGGWRDNAGQSGSFVFTPGAGTLGPRRGLVPSTFVHVVTTANRVAMGRPDNATCFSHPLTDGNPDALIFFTRNLGRASQGRPVVPGPVSLVYQDIPSNVPRFDNVWCLRRTNDLDNPAIPLGTAFTIRVALR